jgi:hypothetical protein
LKVSTKSSTSRSPLCERALDEMVAPPARQGAARRETERVLQHSREEVRERRRLRRPGRIARQVRHRAAAQAEAMLAPVLRQELDLHARHVDAGRAFALAALARHAQVQRLLDGIEFELAREREAQRVRAPAREVRLVQRRAVGGTHGAGVELAAVAVVVAHLGGLVVAAPFAPVQMGLQRNGSVTRCVAE